MSKIQLKTGLVCIKGNFRDNNEDRALIDPQERFFIVCDGMGGQAAGEKASELATELVAEKLEQTINFEDAGSNNTLDKIDKAVSYANFEIMALSELDPDYHNMGTTIVFLVSVNGHFFAGGVGDSRVYQLQGDNFEQLTTDHSLTQALVDAGTINAEEAETHRYKNVLYRYLGTKDGGSGTEAKKIEPQKGDRYLLCSDGVTDGASPETIRELLESINDPQEAAQKVVEAAQSGGSKDNITCLIVHVD